MDIKLNLIPFEKRRHIENNERFRLAVKTEIGLAAVMLCFLAMLFSFKFILNMDYRSNIATQEKINKEDQYVKIHSFDERFSSINSQTAQIIAAENDQLYWSNLFIEISGAIFPGIKINSLESNDYYLTINGRANNRGDLILYKEKLENLECLADIDLPLSELVAKDNVEFQINCKIKPECLKKTNTE